MNKYIKASLSIIVIANLVGMAQKSVDKNLVKPTPKVKTQIICLNNVKYYLTPSTHSYHQLTVYIHPNTLKPTNCK